MDEYFLTRRFDIESSEDYKDATGNILQKYLYEPDERIQDMSCNLLGHYTTDHAKIEFTKKGKEAGYIEYCEPDIEVNPPLPNEHFVIIENRRCWFVNIGDILDINGITVIKNDKDVQIKPIVEHSCNKGNFWHFSIRWEVDGSDLYKDEIISKSQKNKIAQRIGSTCKVIFMHLASDNIPDNVPILHSEEFKKAI